jgi:hypothetical protein
MDRVIFKIKTPVDKINSYDLLFIHLLRYTFRDNDVIIKYVVRNFKAQNSTKIDNEIPV